MPHDNRDEELVLYDITDRILQRILDQVETEIPVGKKLICFCCGRNIESRKNAFITRIPILVDEFNKFKRLITLKKRPLLIPGLAIIVGGNRTCNHAHTITRAIPDMELDSFMLLMKKMRKSLINLAPMIIEKTSHKRVIQGKCILCDKALKGTEPKFMLQSWVGFCLLEDEKKKKQKWSATGNLVIDKFVEKVLALNEAFCSDCNKAVTDLFPFKKKPTVQI